MTNDPITDTVANLAREIASARRVTALTSTRISTESGAPDFRGESGIWERYDPEQFHVRRFDASPGEFWADWIDVYDEVLAEDVAPSDGHEALAELVLARHLDSVVTQNADGLHQAAGAPDDNVIELHGSTREVVCRRYHGRFTLTRFANRYEAGRSLPGVPIVTGFSSPAAYSSASNCRSTPTSRPTRPPRRVTCSLS